MALVQWISFVIAKLDDISTQLENLQNALTQNTNILAFNHRSSMEQRLSSVDETLFQNPMMIPQTTEVPRPKLMNSDVKPETEMLKKETKSSMRWA